MLNGTKRNAPVGNRARLIAISPAVAPVAEEGEKAPGEAAGAADKSDPKWMRWLLIPLITLLSALFGGIAAWLLR